MPGPAAQPTPAKPLTVVQPNGGAPDPQTAQIGEPGQAIGEVRCAVSTLRMTDAAKPFVSIPESKEHMKLIFAGVGGAAGLIIALLNGIGLLALGSAAIFGGIGYMLGNAKFPKWSPTTLGTCTYVGSEGIMTAQRTDAAEAVEVIRFDEAPHLQVERVHRTVTRPDGSSFSYNSLEVTLFSASGFRKFWQSTSESDEKYALSEALEKAHIEYQLPRTVEALQRGNPINFPMARGLGHVALALDRIELSQHGKVVQVRPFDIQRAEVKQGYLEVASSGGNFRFKVNDVYNSVIMLACLEAIGVKIA